MNDVTDTYENELILPCGDLFTTVPPEAETEIFKMKKLVLSLAITTLMFVFIPAQSEAVYGGKPATNEADAVAATVMINRLKEIDAMDKSSMNAPEKKVLRKEVRKIKRELTVSGGGIYLSVGALLLVIILLIVLL